jgi:hypothetical protein
LCEQHEATSMLLYVFPKKSRLGPQNGSKSSGPEKLLKIVNYQNCQKTVLSQLEKVGGHQYPPRSVKEVGFMSVNLDLEALCRGLKVK